MSFRCLCWHGLSRRGTCFEGPNACRNSAFFKQGLFIFIYSLCLLALRVEHLWHKYIFYFISMLQMDCLVCSFCFRFIGSIELQIGRRLYLQSLGDSANDKCHMGSSSHTSEDCYNTDSSDMEDGSYMKNHEDYGNCAPGSSKDNISLPKGFIESLMNGELELPFSDKFPLPSTIPCPGGCGEACYCR